MGRPSWDTGLAFGTISAAKDDQQIEITTFRADTYDRVSRNPEVSTATASRAIWCAAISPSTRWRSIGADGSLEFVDPLGGMDALLEGVLDTPAAPEKSFDDDPLRMLRAARFVVATRIRVGAAGAWRRSRDGRSDRPDHRRAGARRTRQADLGAAPDRRHQPHVRDRSGAAGAAGGARDEARDRRAPPAQGRVPAFADRAAAGDRPGGRRPRPGVALGRAAARHRQAATPSATSPAAASASTITRWSARRWCASGCGRCKYSEGDDRGRRAAGVPASAVPRVRQGAVDGFGGAPVRHRCRRTAAPAAQAGARRLHHPQQASRGRAAAHLRRAGGADRPDRASRRTWPGCVPTWTATRSWSCSGMPAGSRRWARRGST